MPKQFCGYKYITNDYTMKCTGTAFDSGDVTSTQEFRAPASFKATCEHGLKIDATYTSKNQYGTPDLFRYISTSSPLVNDKDITMTCEKATVKEYQDTVAALSLSQESRTQ